MIYHVSKTGNDKNCGNKTAPFLTISKAAQVALPGDTVIVHEGVYREWVSPKTGGASDIERITYKAADNEKVIIKGSERITDWTPYEGTVWKAEINNSLFGDYNPYTEKLSGDWLLEPTHFSILLGDVYLNGRSFYQAACLEEVKEAKIRYYGYKVPLTATPEKIKEPEQTKYLWYSEVNDNTTVIYANFHGFDPCEELTEINVRKCCFYPKESGLNYITVQGFEMAHAACPWAPPTADQPGLLGTNWSKGWIIENNIIHDAKCSGISIGKEKHSITLKGFDPCVTISEEDGKVYLEISLPEGFEKILAKLHSTDTLGKVRINGCIFDSPNGEKLILNTDMLYNKRGTIPKAGPLEDLHSGKNRIQLS